jgi:Na+-transporting methylmalonyl-CoA/oxaloacetate decarboxylase gamma subunit
MFAFLSEEMIALSISGIVIVFLVLALIALVVAGFRRLDEHWAASGGEGAEEALEKEPTIDATTLVLITAACATVVAGRFRVKRVRRLLSPNTAPHALVGRGRVTLQGSHVIQRRRGAR